MLWLDHVAYEFDIELADGVEPDYWAFVDVSRFRDLLRDDPDRKLPKERQRSLVVKAKLPADSKVLESLKMSDELPAAEKVYREKHRPLFHFTSRFGWLNDPNGLVYHDKEWHLFYQHNPFGVNWGNMHWGHAVSSDLVRWKEEGIALYPKQYGDWAFSGSAVVDHGNTSGWGTKEKPPLVLAYTSTGRGECIAFSNDNGRSWKEYTENPVVKHSGRDPKLIWYAPGKHWVMAVYDEADKKQWIAFYTSPDLKTWTFTTRIEGFYECPDLFSLPITGKPSEEKWVLYAADGKYLVGDFDGKEFKPDFKEKKQLWYGKFYAAQTFENALPNKLDGKELPRRVQIGWAIGVTFPGMPFNQQMTVPVELKLARPGKEVQLLAEPVRELVSLREEKPASDIKTMKVTVPATLAEDVDVFDIVLEIDTTTNFTLDLRGTKLVYDAKQQALSCKGITAPAKAKGVFIIQVLVDRGSIEVFGPWGYSVMSIAAIPDEKNRKVQLIPDGEMVVAGRVWRMKSAWEK